MHQAGWSPGLEIFIPYPHTRLSREAKPVPVTVTAASAETVATGGVPIEATTIGAT